MLKHIQVHYKINQDLHEPGQCELLKSVKLFRSLVLIRWAKACRKTNRFLDINANWLDVVFKWPQTGCCKVPLQVASVRRPEKPFHECGHRSKRRKTAAWSQMASPEELAFAAQVKLQQEGKRNAATILKGVTQASSRLKEIKAAYRETKTTQEVKPFTPDEALMGE